MTNDGKERLPEVDSRSVFTSKLLKFVINFVEERHIVKPDKICRFRDLKFAACEQAFDVDDADEIAVFDGAFARIFLE